MRERYLGMSLSMEIDGHYTYPLGFPIDDHKIETDNWTRRRKKRNAPSTCVFLGKWAVMQASRVSAFGVSRVSALESFAHRDASYKWLPRTGPKRQVGWVGSFAYKIEEHDRERIEHSANKARNSRSGLIFSTSAKRSDASVSDRRARWKAKKRQQKRGDAAVLCFFFYGSFFSFFRLFLLRVDRSFLAFVRKSEIFLSAIAPLSLSLLLHHHHMTCSGINSGAVLTASGSTWAREKKREKSRKNRTFLIQEKQQQKKKKREVYKQPEWIRSSTRPPCSALIGCGILWGVFV